MSARKKNSKVSPARLAALDALTIRRKRGIYAQESIRLKVEGSGLEESDKAFATRLVLGVVSYMGTLDELIDSTLQRSSDISASVRDALRIGAYEIFFLDTQPHAAVDQRVELVMSVAPKASGVDNFVLRRLVETKEVNPFRDADHNFEVYAKSQGFPPWLAKYVENDLGEDGARRFMEYSNELAPIFIAVNSILADEEEVRLALEDAEAEPVEVFIGNERVNGCYELRNRRALGYPGVQLLLDEGKIIVSDASPQFIASLALSRGLPSSLLEFGSGEGTKTILIQSDANRKFGSQISDYVCIDSSEIKVKTFEERMALCGVEVAEAVAVDGRDAGSVLQREFEVVFLDAPCTCMGTLRRHPDLRWRVNPEKIETSSSLELQLLKASSRFVAPGGMLIYSTCSPIVAEAQQVIDSFLAGSEGSAFKRMPIGGQKFFEGGFESGGGDAHFACMLKRKA
ncbi:MAG: antitermination protein NusB [Eggerthellaceae bacterium]|nr:antitermination protein NusB [Eggerthellaceae bacterium]